MTPVEILEAAAAKVLETAAAATPGPWKVVRHYRRKHRGVLANVELVKPGRTSSVTMKVPREVADAEWGALLHPGMGALLAGWLDDEAKDLASETYELTPGCCGKAHTDAGLLHNACAGWLTHYRDGTHYACPCWDRSLTLARALLREA